MMKVNISLKFLAFFLLLITLSIFPSIIFANPLPVPFKAQVPPGTWADTQNCGQTSALMVFSYHNGTTPTEQGIKDIDDWLYQHFGDPIRDYNGSNSDTTELESLAKNYASFSNSYKASGWGLNELKNQINLGRPVIAAVVAGYLPNRGYNYAGGHFVVVVGYTDTDIICNDPGTTYGEKKYYSNNDFSTAFSAQNGAIVLVVSSTPPTWPPPDWSLIKEQSNDACYLYSMGKKWYITDSIYFADLCPNQSQPIVYSDGTFNQYNVLTAEKQIAAEGLLGKFDNADHIYILMGNPPTQWYYVPDFQHYLDCRQISHNDILSLTKAPNLFTRFNGNNAPTLTPCSIPPSITSIDPTAHEVGSFTVSINGSNFTGATAVTLYNASTGQWAGDVSGFAVDPWGALITAPVNIPNAGTYYFTVTTPGGTSNNSPNLQVNQLVAPPVADFIASPGSGNAPLTVQFTDASTGNITSRSWNFGDGTNSTATSPSHTYNSAGTYTATLTVSGPGGSNSKTTTITVTTSAPVANFAANPTSGSPPLIVQFTDASTGNITSRLWEFGDGNTSTATNPSHTYNTSGTYTAKLTVTGPGGSNSKTTTITVSSSAPVANFTANPTSGTPPLTVQFTDASTGNITSRSWDFGDGNTSTATSPSHTYNNAGTYTTTLTVTGPGGSNSKTTTITVASSAPVANFTANHVSGAPPLTVQFTDASTGNITSRLWEFGDGNTSTVTSPSHTYNNSGTYTAKLTVTGPGGSNSKSTTITVTSSSPLMTLSTHSLSFTCNAGQSPTKTFEVWNSGGGTSSYNISTNVSWLWCEPYSGTSDGEHDLITVHCVTSGLSVGSYQGTITVAAQGVTDQTINVDLQVNPQPCISRNPTSLDQTCNEGENASNQTFEVWNPCGGTLEYNITWTCPNDSFNWLSCTPSSGTSTGEHDTVTVSYNTASLKAGNYYGRIIISSPDVNVLGRLIEVGLTVNSGPPTVPAILTDRTTVMVPKGKTALLKVKLSKQPTSDMVISTTKVSGISEISILEGSSLTFTTTNWNTYQIVKLGATTDNININGKAVIQLSSSGLSPVDVTAIKISGGTTSILELLLSD